MSRISRETIDRIFETARIEEVVADFVNLKRSGSSLRGLSPFTQEKTPSFYVVPAKQIFKDFSSGKGGTVVTFLMELEHFTYPEALRYLAKRYGIEIEEDEQTPEQEQAQDERESLYLLNEFAANFFREQMETTEEGKAIGWAYFKERGFTDATLKTFGLGYSPEYKSALAEAAIKAQYNPDYLEKTGLAIPRENQWIDRFRGRVMFPIHSMSGRVLGFGARLLKTDAKAAKYLNSPESEIYHKSKVLYGLFQAKRTILQQDRCLLVEGYTDVLAMHQAGIENVVSSSGTALTQEQVRLIKRFTPNVTILYDGDAAGIRASFRGIDLFLEEGLNVKVLLFPDGDDPDSFARKHHVDEIKEFIATHQQDFIRFKTGLLLGDAQGDPIKKAGLIRDIVSSIARIPDGITRDVYLKECAALMEMEEQVLAAEMAQMRKRLQEEEFNRRKREEQRPSMQVIRSQEAPPDFPDYPGEEGMDNLPLVAPAKQAAVPHLAQERDLMRLVLLFGEQLLRYPSPEEEIIEETVASFVLEDLAVDDIALRYPLYAQVQAIILDATRAGRTLPAHELLEQLPADEHGHITELITEQYHLSDWRRKDIFVKRREDLLLPYARESVLRYKRLRIEDFENEAKEALKATMEEQERNELLKKVVEWGKLKRQIDADLNRVV